MVKQIIFVIGVLIFANCAAFSLQKRVGVSVSHNYIRGIERGLTSYAFESEIQGEKLGAMLGFQSNDLLCDVSALGKWWVFTQELDYCTLRYGLDAVYHYEHFRYDGESITKENDFLADICFSLTMENDFSFNICSGYGAKLSFLPALEKPIVDFTPCVYIGVSKRFASAYELSFSSATHTFYRYPLFCSPDYTLTFSYTSSNGVCGSLSGDVRINDQFTTAPYINRIALTASLLFHIQSTL